MTSNTTFLITTGVTVGLAFIGYLVTYINSLSMARRKEKLERVNRQLSELYGPMFGITHASETAWKEFKKRYRFGALFEGKPRAKSKEFAAFRLWMTTIFMPMNKHLFDLILAKSDLLLESEMPECMLQYCAHIAAYEAVLERWKQKDFTEIQSVIHYPAAINDYARKSFSDLKAQQDKLIGKK